MRLSLMANARLHINLCGARLVSDAGSEFLSQSFRQKPSETWLVVTLGKKLELMTNTRQ